MPLYTYRCHCGREWDEMRPIKDRHFGTGCPQCDCCVGHNIGVYKVYMKTDIKGPGAAWRRDPRESRTAVLREDYDPPVESRKDEEELIKRKGVVPLG